MLEKYAKLTIEQAKIVKTDGIKMPYENNIKIWMKIITTYTLAFFKMIKSRKRLEMNTSRGIQR